MKYLTALFVFLALLLFDVVMIAGWGAAAVWLCPADCCNTDIVASPVTRASATAREPHRTAETDHSTGGAAAKRNGSRCAR